MAENNNLGRRTFLKNTSLATLCTLLGADIVFAHQLPRGYIPLALQDGDPFSLYKKNKGMRVLNEQPLNMEAQAHLLDDKITPEEKMFVRNNGLVPQNLSSKNWTLEIKGEAVSNPKTYTLQALKNDFKTHTYQLTLECAGNGRSEFYPPASGNQWTIGAVSCAQWTGLRLRDLLEDVGIRDVAVYIGYHGRDPHLSGDPNKASISRGIPISKAMEDETLLAYAMNGKEIPLIHGFPLRLVAGGFPASASGKWLHSLSIRDRVHDGAKMEAPSYRVPCEPVEPGQKVPDENMCIIESMPVKSLITYPKSGAMIPFGKRQKIRGHAWAGENQVSKMQYSIDFGSTWFPCSLEKPINRLAWQHFEAEISFPKKGYYEIWVKATDDQGKSQPMLLPGWNPKGYLNNACHRIAIKVQ